MKTVHGNSGILSGLRISRLYQKADQDPGTVFTQHVACQSVHVPHRLLLVGAGRPRQVGCPKMQTSPRHHRGDPSVRKGQLHPISRPCCCLLVTMLNRMALTECRAVFGQVLAENKVRGFPKCLDRNRRHHRTNAVGSRQSNPRPFF